MSSGDSTAPPSGPDRDDDPVAPSEPTVATPRDESAVSAATTSIASSIQTGHWPAHAADLVVEVVAAVRDKTATPILTIARGVVYGTAIVFLAVSAVVLLLIALVRFVDVYLPGGVWSAYLLLGSLLTIGGLILWATRYPKDA